MENERHQGTTSEEEPLLGQQGDASLESGQPLYYNFWLGKLALSPSLFIFVPAPLV